jgi:hypothetical protein
VLFCMICLSVALCAVFCFSFVCFLCDIIISFVCCVLFELGVLFCVIRVSLALCAVFCFSFVCCFV